jgi:alpha-galactosidase
MSHTFYHDLFHLIFTGTADEIWRYQLAGSTFIHPISAPVFEIDGEQVVIQLSNFHPSSDPQPLPNGSSEMRYSGEVATHPGLSCQVVLRTAPGDPVVRYRYRLTSTSPRRLTRAKDCDNLCYARLSFPSDSSVTEVVLSEFHEMTHAYHLEERPVPVEAIQAGLAVPGPILVCSGESESFLMAYEHGSTMPNTYLEYRLSADPQGGHWANLAAVKGNYYTNQPLDPEHPYETIWMQFAAVYGNLEKLASAYRRFILEHFSLFPASRQPLIFYNTWNFQERNKHWNGKPYLESMNEARILQEIEIAHQIGIDVFVLDTGWYGKTGDWEVDSNRFPRGLAPIQNLLKQNQMRLGLWFNPGAAAVSSRLHRSFRDCVISRHGKESQPHPVWETEESRSFCLVSRYADAFADELIRLNRELGVSYFKWDAVGQENGCSSPNHHHGSSANTEAERAACYEFSLVQALVRIAEKVSRACPEAIFDLDMTESGRSLGLAFLSAGKYFLINNGPYYANYDQPMPGTNENLFFFPGAARATLCREALSYDRWIPALLFLTHYFPDETPQPEPHWSLPHGRADSLEVNLASLILGHNGIWGDLLNLSPHGIQRIAEFLAAYKRVAAAITRATPIRSGSVGSSPEIHEKLEQGRGVVVIFSPRKGVYEVVTHQPALVPFWKTEGIEVQRDAQDRAILRVSFSRPGAQVVFFAG